MCRSAAHLRVVDHLRVELGVADGLLELRVVEREGFQLLCLFAARAAAKQVDAVVTTVEHAFEAVAAANRPEQGAADDAELGLNLVDDLEGRERRSVELVDEREEWQPAQPRNLEPLGTERVRSGSTSMLLRVRFPPPGCFTHLEQLPRLRLKALGAVDQHDGVVCGC